MPHAGLAETQPEDRQYHVRTAWALPEERTRLPHTGPAEAPPVCAAAATRQPGRGVVRGARHEPAMATALGGSPHCHGARYTRLPRRPGHDFGRLRLTRRGTP